MVGPKPEGEEEEGQVEEEEGEEKKKKTVTKTVWDWELMNAIKPIWTRKWVAVCVFVFTSFLCWFLLLLLVSFCIQSV